MVFLGLIQAFPQLSWIILFEIKRTNLHLGKQSSTTYSFQKLLNYHRETMCLMLLLLSQMVFFCETNVFSQLSWIFTLKNLSCRKFPFQKGSHFSQGSNAVDTPVQTHVVFIRGNHVHQLSSIGLFQKPVQQCIFRSKTNTTLTGRQCARCCCCVWHRWFSLKGYKCFFKAAE
jgi:hypothetical protein